MTRALGAIRAARQALNGGIPRDQVDLLLEDAEELLRASVVLEPDTAAGIARIFARLGQRYPEAADDCLAVAAWFTPSKEVARV